MNPSSEALLTFANQAALELLVWSWQALILLACVGVGLKLLRVQTPALRQHIWLIGLLAVFTLPLWSRLAPKLPLSARQRWHSPALNYAAELPRVVIAPAVETTLPARQSMAGTAAAKNRTVAKILAGVFFLWVVGALLLFARNLRSYARLRQTRQHARPATPAELDLALRLPQFVSLRMSAEIRSPVLLGLWQPLILLPHNLAEWTTVEERNAMIAHELAHLARRDHFTNLFPLALNLIFFFHPLVRYACRQFCLEREMACDDCVIHHGADATTYAESLIKAAEHSLKGKLGGLTAHSMHQPAFFNSKQALERRIEMILNTNRVRVLTRQWRYLILPAVLIAVLAWLLVPNRPATAQQLQWQLNGAAAAVKDGSLKELLIKYMADSGAYNDLVKAALSDDPQLREQAIRQLAESEREWATTALGEVYDRTDDLKLRSSLIEQFGQRKALTKLLEIALSDRTSQLRRQAVERLLETEGDGSDGALAELYTRSSDGNTRDLLIQHLGQRNDTDALGFIWHWEDAPERRQAVLRQLELIAQNNESADARKAALETLANIKAASTRQSTNDLPPPPPPPPPPGPLNLNDSAAVLRMLKEDPNDDSIVLALLRETVDAQIRHDTAFLERALADDYEAIGPGGEVLNKAESIAEARRLDQHIKKFEIDNYRLRDDGSSAIANFLGTVYYEENGKENTIQFRYTVNFYKRQGGWQIVGSHQSRIR